MANSRTISPRFFAHFDRWARSVSGQILEAVRLDLARMRKFSVVREELSSLTAAELSEIGISRCEIVSVARREAGKVVL